MRFHLHIHRFAFQIGLLVISSAPAWAQINACDLAPPYGTINAADVQAIINMSIGITPCTANIAGRGVCNAAVVQRVVNAAKSADAACDTGYLTDGHYVSLSWTASTTPHATYNVYRSTTKNAYSSVPLAFGVSGTSYLDFTVAAGSTYYYVITAVSGGRQSGHSTEVQAKVPTP